MNKMAQKVGLGLSLVYALVLMGCAGTANQESTGEFIDSKAITTKLKAALIDDPVVHGMSIDVDTFKGVVELSGTVNTAQEKKRAEELAWGIDGVKAVKNNIAIREPIPTNTPPSASGPTPQTTSSSTQ